MGPSANIDMKDETIETCIRNDKVAAAPQYEQRQTFVVTPSVGALHLGSGPGCREPSRRATDT